MRIDRRGEVGDGEAMVNRMLRNAKTPEHIWQCCCLLQLETEGKLLMRPTLSKWGMPFFEPQERKEAGEAIADQAAQVGDWVEMWGARPGAVRACSEDATVDEQPHRRCPIVVVVFFILFIVGDSIAVVVTVLVSGTLSPRPTSGGSPRPS